MKPDQRVWLQTAMDAAREAGKILRENWEGDFETRKKGDIDLVTEVDVEVENRVIELLRKQFPQHSILAEESGQDESDQSNFRWIIDPLDGTTNFSHGYPCFCVSIALEVEGQLQVGVIYNPLLNEMFSAVHEHGAFLNNNPIHVSQTGELAESLLVTGFAYDVRENKKNNLDQFSDFILKARGVRRDGSAALDFCYVAAGRFDGFWEFHLKPWDMAAGVLLVQEAGGQVTAMDGSAFSLKGKSMLASNGKIHQEMLDVLAKRL